MGSPPSAGPDDSPERHAADTIAAGAGLCDPRAVEVLVREAPEAVAELVAMGMRFDEGDASALEGGHSARRVHHAGGDRSGRALHRFLEEVVERHGGIVRVDARAVAVELRDGAVASGVRVEGGALIAADRVVLATGGACGIYGRRTAPTRRSVRGSRSRGTRARRSPTWSSCSSTRRRWTCRATPRDC